MNENIKFEIKADAFLRMTGMLAPGKAAWQGPSHSERAKAWEKWQDDNRTIIYSMMEAIESILGDKL